MPNRWEKSFKNLTKGSRGDVAQERVFLASFSREYKGSQTSPDYLSNVRFKYPAHDRCWRTVDGRFCFHIGFLCVRCSCDYWFLYISLCVGVCGRLCCRGPWMIPKLNLYRGASHILDALKCMDVLVDMHTQNCSSTIYSRNVHDCIVVIVQYVLLFCIAK